MNTVSRALKGKSDIGLDTQKRIKRIADKMGYVPYAAAANLRSRSSKMIGVIVTFLDNPFYARILNGINDTLSERGYSAIVCGNNEDAKLESSILANFAAQRVAGLLIVPASDLVNKLDYDRIKTQHVTIVRRGNLSSESYFAIETRKAGRMVARHLYETGRRNPAFLGLDLAISCGRDRLNGFRTELQKFGMSLPARALRRCSPTAKAAYNTIRKWLSEGWDYDSVFIENDQLAFGALRAFNDAGIKVPDQVAVVAHDDVEAAQYFTPSLSTVNVPKYRLGKEAAQYLLELIEDGDSMGPRQKMYEPRLAIRESSAKR